MQLLHLTCTDNRRLLGSYGCSIYSFCWSECWYRCCWGNYWAPQMSILLPLNVFTCASMFLWLMWKCQAGLGGSRDATNIVTSNELAAAVITTIGKEHLAALGGSLESITLAKSGIIKHGRPVQCFFLCWFLREIISYMIKFDVIIVFSLLELLFVSSICGFCKSLDVAKCRRVWPWYEVSPQFEMFVAILGFEHSCYLP